MEMKNQKFCQSCAKPMADSTGMTAAEAKAQMATFFPQLERKVKGGAIRVTI